MTQIIKNKKITMGMLNIMSMFLIAALAFIFIIFKLKPSVVIHNNTAQSIHIYVMERDRSNDEPSVQEVEQLKKVRIVKPDGELTVTPSLGSLLKRSTGLDIGWRIDSRTESPSGSGSQGFSMDSENGACHYAIHIHESKSEWQKERGDFCTKKITPLNQEIE
ncbi:hypothetical protein [Serratia oryzae]|uniref:Uncharacterized protein n=1 Tax=Serratia oryzae TaxID=2034155 RepID=A0A1S8CII7_9GAMM|nr:hypothetical protein [Serratia oryzae]OMQ21468.1 hypothetical protein BMI79_15425 [Serratia oryzae]VXD08685.1 conserved hypothetical protein [Enterobacterales bacterium 8AC]